MLRAALDPKVYEETLFDALVDARARYGDKEILEDQDRHPLTYTGLIRAAFVLGRKIANMTDKGERVAILLPSSMGVVVTFLGLLTLAKEQLIDIVQEAPLAPIYVKSLTSGEDAPALDTLSSEFDDATEPNA